VRNMCLTNGRVYAERRSRRMPEVFLPKLGHPADVIIRIRLCYWRAAHIIGPMRTR
jgi:hypothetical protein